MNIKGQIILAGFVFFILTAVAGATATYDTVLNRIVLIDGINTLQSIYEDINNPAVLSYDAGSNTYTLNASIETANDVVAKPSLTIADTTLLVNSTSDDQYHINGGLILTITNSTIKSNNNTRYRIWAPSIWGSQCKFGACARAGYYVTIDSSTIIGGWVYLRMDSDALPISPYIRITNTVIKDVDTRGAQIPKETTHGSTNPDHGPLVLFGEVGYRALLENLTFENAHGDSSNFTMGGIIAFTSSAANIILRDITFDSMSSGGCAISVYGSAKDVIFENIKILGTFFKGIWLYEALVDVGKTVRYKNINIETNSSDAQAFYTYQNRHVSTFPSGVRVENLILGGKTTPAEYLFYQGHGQRVHVWVFNAQLKNAAIGFLTRNTKYFLTNTLVQNITNRMYDVIFGLEEGEVNWYELADIYVTDSNGQPINGATVQITPTLPAPVPNVVDKWFNEKTAIITGADGHTPLPSDETGTVAILRQRDSSSGHVTAKYSYTITASYDNKTASVTVTPSAAWYRSDPLVPVNTITINLADPILSSLVVAPASAYILSGSTRPFTTTAKDQNGNIMSGLMMDWSSSNTAIATIDASGLVTAVSGGTTMITASQGWVSGSATITVVDQPSGLAGYWNFDEGNGITASDSSGQGNHGTLNNMNMGIDNGVSGWTVNGKAGKALMFDGTNDFVDAGNSQTIHNLGNFTFEAWVKFMGDGTAGENGILYDRGGGCGSNGYWFMVSNSRTVRLTVNDQCNNSLSSTVLVKNNGWSHIAGKFDGSKLYVYVDGVEVSKSSIYSSLVPGTVNLRIGGGYYGNFNGSIDEVKIYNRALAVEEILAEYQEHQTEPALVTTGTLYGVIKSSSGAPIPGASVTDGVKNMTTNVLGEYLLTDVLSGSRNISASKTGYLALSQQIEVKKEEAVNLDFTLQVSSAPVTSPVITSFSPENLTPAQEEGTTNIFSVTVDQTVSNKWSLDNIQQAETTQNYSRTWADTDAGIHSIAYTGENENGMASKTWVVSVIDVSKIPKANNPEINVYPNPYVKGKSNSEKITFGNLRENTVIKIYNTGGELVKELTAGAENEVEWNINGVSSGIYLYVAISAEGAKKGKVSIVK